MPVAARMRNILWLLLSPCLAAIAFWSLFAACVVPDVPDDPEPVARLIASWDPLACGEPHRVVLELEDEDGNPLSSSTPCWLGGLAVDVPRWGWYTGRLYTWVAGQPIRSIRPVTLAVDAAIVRWQVDTPP